MGIQGWVAGHRDCTQTNDRNLQHPAPLLPRKWHRQSQPITKGLRWHRVKSDLLNHQRRSEDPRQVGANLGHLIISTAHNEGSPGMLRHAMTSSSPSRSAVQKPQRRGPTLGTWHLHWHHQAQQLFSRKEQIVSLSLPRRSPWRGPNLAWHPGSPN